MNGNRLLDRLLALLLALLCWSFAAFPASAAEDGDSFEAEYAATVYDYFSGFPYTEANVMAQTPDGYLYIGSYGGLTRFDGQRFEVVSDISSAVCLYVDRQGRLWVGTNEMGAVCLEQGVLTVYGQADGLPSDSIRGFWEDPDGGIYIATVSGLVMLERTGSVLPVLDDRLRSVSVTMLSGDGAGTVYGVTVDGNAFALRERSVVNWWSVEEIGADVGCVYADPLHEGLFWCGTEGSEVLRCTADRPVSDWEHFSIPGVSGVNCLLLESDRLWVCCGDGIGWLDAAGSFYRLDHIPVRSAVEHILQDMEGNLWLSSSRRGVLKLSKSRFTDVNVLAGLREPSVSAVWVEGETVWLGTDTGLRALDEAGKALELPPCLDALSGVSVRSVVGDGNGSLWICSDSELGLARYEPKTRRLSWLREADGLPSNHARDVLVLDDGTLLVSTPEALCLLRGGAVSRCWGQADGLCDSEILSMCQAPDGTVLLGSNGDGLFVLEHGALLPFSASSELQGGVILRLLRDLPRQCVWILSGSGELGVLKDGSIRSLDGLLPNASHSGSPFYDLLLYEDELWLLGGTGLCAVRAQLLLDGSPQTGRSYNRGNGLPHVSAPHSRSFVTADGTAWLSGSDGLTRMSFADAEGPKRIPMFAIPWVEIDETRLLPPAGESLELASDNQRLRIHAAAITFALEDPELVYRLEGYEDAWTHATAATLTDVVYTNLPGGDYVFRFGSPGGEAGELQAEFALRIHKELAFYEHPTVWILGLLILLLLVAALIWLLLRRQRKSLARKHEEARINNELSMAAKIQMDMLPDDSTAVSGREEFEIEAMMHPAKEVGGDFYDFFLVDEDHLAVAVADVSGKGVPAALFMIISMALLKSETKVRLSPARVLEAVNAKLSENNPNNMFVTVWLGVLELSTGLLTWADGGHEKPLLYHNGTWDYLEKHNGVAVALMEPELLELEEDPPFVDQEICLKPGDLIFQYTDGVPEATNANDQLFGAERLLEALRDSSAAQPKAVLKQVKACVDGFVGTELQFDDITMLALEYRGR
ncbi:MAG: SpoIIE family protein phosphatase [Oscillospiraceae bacterium]|nr:SpoIIE family protein phosphatase [Oscillospiraceae bacterium]